MQILRTMAAVEAFSLPKMKTGSKKTQMMVMGGLVMLLTIVFGIVGIKAVNSQMGHHMGGRGYYALIVGGGAAIGATLLVEVVTFYIILNLAEFKEELTRQAQESCNVMGRCQHGDLTARMPEDGDIPQMNTLAGDFNRMMDQMEALVSAAKEFSGEVAAASQETASSIENAEHATEEVSEVTEAVSRDIESRLEESLDQMERLQGDAEQISQVAEFVGDVARQTNMLGLNARIEASKSEQENAGFKTVAGQVKELADETHAAADDIQDLLERLQTQVNETLEDIEETGETVEAGTVTIQHALDALTEDETAPGELEQFEQLDVDVLPEDANGQSADGSLESANIPEVRRSAEELAHRAGQLQQALGIFDISDEVDYSVLDIDRDEVQIGGQPPESGRHTEVAGA